MQCYAQYHLLLSSVPQIKQNSETTHPYNEPDFKYTKKKKTLPIKFTTLNLTLFCKTNLFVRNDESNGTSNTRYY